VSKVNRQRHGNLRNCPSLRGKWRPSV